MEEEGEQREDEEPLFNPATETDAVKNTAPLSVIKKQDGRKRARMLRFLDKRLARLQLKSHSTDASSTSSNNNSSNRNNNSNDRRRLDYEQRKAAWAAKYTSVSTLRQSFGKNKNRLWGDFDPTTTRKLYHTLLPRALLELRGLRDGLLSANDVVDGLDEEEKRRENENENSQWQRIRPSSTDDDDDDDSNAYLINNILDHDNNDDQENNYLQEELKELAPLAYQARLAAKKYARERSRLPGRIGSMLYDGYRSWRRYGKWKSSGMTWEQVWNKYEDQVLREAQREAEMLLEGGVTCLEEDDDENCVPSSMDVEEEGLDDEELTARICLRILERSVVTNDAIDKLFLKRLAEDENTGDVGESSSSSATTNNNNNVIQESKKRQQRRHRLRKRKSRIQADLRSIEKKFDDDIRELLRYSTLTTRDGEERRSRRKKRGVFACGDGDAGASVGDTAVTNTTSSTASSTVANDTPSELNLDDSVGISVEGQEAAETTATNVSGGNDANAAAPADDGEDAKLRKLAVHEVFALRILATTKQRITSLQALPQFGGGGRGSDTDTEGAATGAVTASDDENDQQEL